MVKRKIIIAANSDLCFDQRLHRIASSLSDAQYSVFLLGRSFLHSPNLTSEKFEQKRVNLWFQKGKLAYLELNIRLFINLLRVDMDALCSVDLDTLPACWLIKKLRGVKLVYDAHEYMEEVPEVFERPLTRWIWRQVALNFIPSADLAYTVSQSFVKEFKEIYKVDFGLVRNITLLQEEKSYPETGKYGSGYWVFLGAVNRGRGIEEFLEILPSTNRKLVILGTGDRFSDIKKMVADRSLEHLVVFCGKVKPQEAREIMHYAWAGINLLTHEGLSYYYSIANKFFDYLHAGIPQICIRFPEYELLNKEHEVAVLCSLNIKSLQAAAEIISNPEVQQKLRKETLIARQTWNWQKESENLIGMYKTLFS